MRTCLIFYFGSTRRGCWIRLQRLIDSLRLAGTRCIIVVNDRSVSHLKCRHNVAVIQLGTRSRSVNSLIWLFLSPIAALLLAARYNVSEAIVFDFHNAYPLTLVRSRLRTPFAIAVRGASTVHIVNNGYTRLERWTLSAMTKVGTILAEKVVFTSHASAAASRPLLEGRSISSCVIQNDILPAKLETGSLPAANRMDIDRKTICFGYCGQFIPRKNVKLILQAIALMPKSEQARCELVLQGADKATKQRLLEVSTEFGIVATISILPWSDRLDSFWRTVDVFILPSVFDDSSNSLLEALGRDKACIAANTLANVEIFGSDLGTFNPSDAGRELARLMCSTVQNNRFLEILTERSRKRREQLQFDWENSMLSELMER